MTPSERAIQSRIKEAFAFKIQHELWKEIVQLIINKQFRQVEPKEYRNTNTVRQAQMRFQLDFEKQDLEKRLFEMLNKFDITEIDEDPLIG